MTVQRVQDWSHDGQVVLACAVCDWSRAALNSTLAEQETTAHVDSAAHVARLAETGQPVENPCTESRTTNRIKHDQR